MGEINGKKILFGVKTVIETGGGPQPKLFAPVITSGMNEVSWANNDGNGNFDVTITATLNGEIVSSPLTVTSEMNDLMLTVTADAENFESSSSSRLISYTTVQVGLEYRLSGDGIYYTLYGIGTETSPTIVIPDTYKGLPVRKIRSSAFYNCTSLTSVTIPDSVTSIGHQAFYNCTNLTSVTISDSVTSIGDLAFYNCTSLTSIIIPDNLTYISNSMFRKCTNLTSVTISDSVTSIGNNAFFDCSRLTSIIIPASVTYFGATVFYNCSSLVAVDFSKHTEVPTLANADGFFTLVPSTCKVIVPDDLYDAWTTATNWSALSITYVKASEV